jgi:hypothetical protein
MANPTKVREVITHMETTMRKNPTLAFSMRTWSMEIWADDLRDLRPDLLDSDDAEVKALLQGPQDEACGTVMCFAGWAVHSQNLDKERWQSWSDMAGYIMELEPREHCIFFDASIKDIPSLKHACNHYFRQSIFDREEMVGSRWSGIVKDQKEFYGGAAL